VFATTQVSAVFVIGSGLLWHHCTIIGCVNRTCARLVTCSYGIFFWRTGGNRLHPNAAFV